MATETVLDALRNDSCPCAHTTPCHDRCTCVNPISSSGCRRCCSYGSDEQQRAAAERLAALEVRAQEACAATIDASELLERYNMLATAYHEEVVRVEKLRMALKEMTVFAKAVAGGQAYERVCALAKIADAP